MPPFSNCAPRARAWRTIAQELGLDRKTARRHADASSPEELLAKATSRTTLLEEFTSHLHARWNAGCTDIAALTAELRERGYRGRVRTVYRSLQPLRGTLTALPAPVAPPKIRHDLAAVTAGLTLPWSNGPTEGTVNRIKMLKRQMFGRAGFPLLRKRILLTP